MTSRPKAQGYALFATALGQCGIAWGAGGIVQIVLPEPDEATLVARLQAPGRTPARPPPAVRRAVRAIQQHLGGQLDSLAEIALDLTGLPPFTRRVYEAARLVGPGQTVSYGELARRAGSPRAARAVGQALAHNPLAVVVPCHRVLGQGGKLGGFSAAGGLLTKAQLLAIEGVTLGTEEKLFSGTVAKLAFEPGPALKTLAQADPELGRLMDRVGPFRLKLRPPRSTFTALAEAIVYQQLTAKAAAPIYRRLALALSPGGDGQGFSPQDVTAATDAEIRAAGLSRAKTAALRDLAAKTLAGSVPPLPELRRMTDEDIVERLVTVRGVGRWTAEMLLIFQLGRPDVLPATDYGIRKGFARAFALSDLPSPQALQRYGERWRPYRTVASWYLWRALELE